jgi:hypothetical protein
MDLMNWLNTLMPGVIAFKFEYSKSNIEFLDLEISIENGRIEKKSICSTVPNSDANRYSFILYYPI